MTVCLFSVLKAVLTRDVVKIEEEKGGERSGDVEDEDEVEDEWGESREGEGESAHCYSSKRRRRRNHSPKDLSGFLKTPIKPDELDEMFLLSLLPEFKQVKTN